MSNAKDIRSQIKSIKSTQKITKAMQMVAASKMRRSQDAMLEGRPYVDNILRVIAHLLKAHGETKHPFFSECDKQVKHIGYIVVSTDRGLCGGLNINQFKKLLTHVREWDNQGCDLQFSVFGRKGIAFVNRINGKITTSVDAYGDNPSLRDLIGGIRLMIDAYRKGEIDRVYLVGNRFVNTMTQEPYIMQFLPATIVNDDDYAPHHAWTYDYEPDAEQLLNQLAVRYLESLVKQAVAENIACEMSARMIAMKSASDNAANLIGELELQYNKARQAAITQELTEIVSGAAAV
ncbi:MAG: F0F1 ATP synthase subunit gamma [Cardiobacteriaceae bacterium]|nr:F0F1 ATP synthase subunit gamma [Cardiobacteriaceae bacterium]